MAWTMDSDRPIYAQLVERIQMQIVSGYYPCGARLPSVRELAAVAAVNPNTMQKAFAELERSGLIVTQRTNGRIVTEDKERVDAIRHDMAKLHLETFVGKMRELGYTKEQIYELLEQSV
ncbi:MAG: GntR family transcriptional regulator [Acetatifactor sp.]|nr:GntR family transcriptional regulator [Acetatifactor sp.]MDE7268971.1 GntR family transcriptional regulator [Acetatifactor sp.]